MIGRHVFRCSPITASPDRGYAASSGPPGTPHGRGQLGAPKSVLAYISRGLVTLRKTGSVQCVPQKALGDHSARALNDPLPLEVMTEVEPH